ncbi:unnamed protein product [Heterobilharzia americana]|nr:unnamed protein product [Heterobilharzia americana]
MQLEMYNYLLLCNVEISSFRHSRHTNVVDVYFTICDDVQMEQSYCKCTTVLLNNSARLYYYMDYEKAYN